MRRANGRQPVAAAEGTANGYGNAAAASTTSRTRGERADAPGWIAGREGGWESQRVGGTKERRIFLPARAGYTRGPFLFPATLPPFPCPAFSCAMSPLAAQHRGANRIRNKTNNLLSRNARDQREDLTYSAQTGSLVLSTCLSPFALPLAR